MISPRSVFLVQKSDQNDTILLYGIIPLIINYRMANVINAQRNQCAFKVGHDDMIKEHQKDAKTLLGVIIRNLNMGIRQLGMCFTDKCIGK